VGGRRSAGVVAQVASDADLLGRRCVYLRSTRLRECHEARDRRASQIDRGAIERADEAMIVGTYADDAEMKVVDTTRPPSAPLVLRGKDAIGELYRDICSRAVTHEVEDPVITSDKIAFNESCRYEDGLRIFSANTIEVRGGQVTRHVVVQAWDEA